jgi:hypothetical protein
MKPSELLPLLRTLRRPVLAIGGGFARIEHHDNFAFGPTEAETFAVTDEARLIAFCQANHIAWRVSDYE